MEAKRRQLEEALVRLTGEAEEAAVAPSSETRRPADERAKGAR
jgi:hypothetical protein